jgi:hypothetical protein
VLIALTNVWRNGADPALHRETYALFDAFVAALRH